MRPLQAANLTLEPQTRHHAEAMYALLRDPAIYEFENEPPRSLEALRERFRLLESELSPQGDERWLNWVVRLRGGAVAGYVQATVLPDGIADIAYVFGSDYWGRGLARAAVELMIGELEGQYGVHTLRAVFKSANFRSRRLLDKLRFEALADDDHLALAAEPDESVMTRGIGPDTRAGPGADR